MANAGTCFICSAVDFEESTAGFHRCNRCGTLRNTPIAAAQKDVLEAEWFDEQFNAASSGWVRIFERWNNNRAYKLLAPYLNPGAAILEVGVGTGSFLGFLKQKAFRVEGCDLSKTIGEYVTAAFGITVHICGVDALPAHSLYDAVVMRHVIEHVSDPISLLKEATQILKPGGLLYIATPNSACWEARLPGWNSYEPYHLVLFTPTSLKLALDHAGLSCEFAITHESFSGWFLAVVRSLMLVGRGSALQKRSSRQQISTSAWAHLYRLFMVVSGAITTPLRWIQKSVTKGDEIIVLARSNK